MDFLLQGGDLHSSRDDFNITPSFSKPNFLAISYLCLI